MYEWILGNLNTIGLTLDIIGALLILKFALQGILTDEGKKGNPLMFTKSHSKEEKQKLQRWADKIYRRNRILFRTGIILLVAGFGLQIVGNTI